MFGGKGKHQKVDSDLRAPESKLSRFILTLQIKIKWQAEEILQKDYLTFRKLKTQTVRTVDNSSKQVDGREHDHNRQDLLLSL